MSHDPILVRELAHRIRRDKRLDASKLDEMLTLAADLVRASMTSTGWSIKSEDVDRFLDQMAARPGFAAKAAPEEKYKPARKHDYRVRRWTNGDFARLSARERLDIANRGGVTRDPETGDVVQYERIQ